MDRLYRAHQAYGAYSLNQSLTLSTWRAIVREIERLRHVRSGNS